MATKSSRLPDKVYVTMKKQPKYDNGVIVGYDTPLGFLNAYEPQKKTWQSKMHTQIEWAYRHYTQNFKWEERGGGLWITGDTWTYAPGTSTRLHVPIAEWADPQPQVYDNTPMRGFKIENSVSRYSTSNKLWRILDPRGFELEISTGCLENIIMEAGILKGGEIDAACSWMSNKNLVVVP